MPFVSLALFHSQALLGLVLVVVVLVPQPEHPPAGGGLGPGLTLWPWPRESPAGRTSSNQQALTHVRLPECGLYPGSWQANQ